MVVLCFFALSLFLLSSCFLNHVMDSLSSSASTVPSLDGYSEHNVLEVLFLEHAFRRVFLLPISWKSTWPRSHSLVTLRLDLVCYKEEVLASAR